MSKIVISTINPKNITNLFCRGDLIKEIVLISVDLKPLVIKRTDKVRKSILYSLDVAGLIIQYQPENVVVNKNGIKQKYIIAENFVLTSNKNGTLINFNGKYEVIKNTLLAQIYSEFESKKNLRVGNIDELLEINSSQPAIKAFNKLSDYFSAEKYSINKNIFKLMEHSNESIKVSKRVILQAIVVYEEVRR